MQIHARVFSISNIRGWVTLVLVNLYITYKAKKYLCQSLWGLRTEIDSKGKCKGKGKGKIFLVYPPSKTEANHTQK